MLEEIPNRDYWIHPYNKKRDVLQISSLIAELRTHEDKFYNFVRMSTKTFDIILKLCKPSLTKMETNFRAAITPEERLFITLR